MNIKSADRHKPISEREINLICRSIDISERNATLEDATYMYKPLCQVGLPRSVHIDSTFERSSGLMKIKIMGYAENTIPYGVAPRLIMSYICSNATRFKTQKVNMQRSAAACMKTFGLKVSGGKRGSYTNFKNQLIKLSMVDFEFTFKQRGSEINYTSKIFNEKSCEQLQQARWNKELELSDLFYDSLVKHKNSVPMDARAVIALKDSALALDIYFFLVERLHRISAVAVKPTILYWKKLRNQFGHEYAASSSGNKSFRDNFLHALEKVLLMYPAASVEVMDGGIILRKSLPPIPKKPNILRP